MSTENYLETYLAKAWMASPYGTPSAHRKATTVEQRIAELSPDSWSPKDHADGVTVHASSGPTEYATYCDRDGRNRYNGRTGPAVASPAPKATVHSGVRPALRPYKVPRDWVGPKDLLSRCRAAARLTLTGKQWSGDDVTECAADILLRTLERHPLLHGYVDPMAAQMARLVHHASDWRKGTERDRARDDRDAATRATVAGKAHVTVASDPTTDGTPMAAAKRAIDAIQNLGLTGARARKLWPLAYTVARVVDGCDGAEIATELGMSHAAYRKAVSRAGQMVHASRTYSPEGKRTVTEDAARLLAAVAADCEAFPLDPRAVAENMGQDPDWPARSAKRYAGTPVTVYRSAEVKRDGRRTYELPAWTRGLSPNTARRLATGSEMRRAREKGRAPADAARRKLAAGLPATVR